MEFGPRESDFCIAKHGRYLSAGGRLQLGAEGGGPVSVSDQLRQLGEWPQCKALAERGRIRTSDTVLPVYRAECGALGHSATSPKHEASVGHARPAQTRSNRDQRYAVLSKTYADRHGAWSKHVT